MRILYRIVGTGALLVLLSLVGACAAVSQPTACSAGAAAGDWLGEDLWVRADLDRVQRELACGANVNATSEYGNTPLHYAAYGNEHAAVIETLLQSRRRCECEGPQWRYTLALGGVLTKTRR